MGIVQRLHALASNHALEDRARAPISALGLVAEALLEEAMLAAGLR